MLGVSEDEAPTLYHARGCSRCNQLGYRGRTGIYELVEVSDAMRAMIHDGEGEQAMERLAREDSPSMRQDGWRKALEGVTTVEEVLRVTQGD
jgi:general secretion pathway protein E